MSGLLERITRRRRAPSSEPPVLLSEHSMELRPVSTNGSAEHVRADETGSAEPAAPTSAVPETAQSVATTNGVVGTGTPHDGLADAGTSEAPATPDAADPGGAWAPASDQGTDAVGTWAPTSDQGTDPVGAWAPAVDDPAAATGEPDTNTSAETSEAGVTAEIATPPADAPAPPTETAAAPTETAAAHAPAETTPDGITRDTAAVAESPDPPPNPDFRERGRLRRRARYLRRLRELQLRDIGGFMLELHRFGRERPELVAAKVADAASTDGELRALEHTLGEQRPVRELREAGIGGACARCGAVHGSADRFCASCGVSLLPMASPAASTELEGIPQPQ
jgi:hypothetical protein